jgi:hypothetical protein
VSVPYSNTVPFLDWDDAYASPLSEWVLGHNPHSLWLWGPTGIGKSRSVSEKLRSVEGIRWLQWSDVVRGIGDYGQVSEEWDTLCRCVCPIVIDDFAITGLTNPVVDGIFHLLETRLTLKSGRRTKYRTYITSMFSPAGLRRKVERVYTKSDAQHKAQAIERRINDLCFVYPKEKK